MNVYILNKKKCLCYLYFELEELIHNFSTHLTILFSLYVLLHVPSELFSCECKCGVKDIKPFLLNKDIKLKIHCCLSLFTATQLEYVCFKFLQNY